MVKNTGPDLDKIVDTITHFGPRYNYLVAAYPPFLKDLRDRLDTDGFDWGSYKLHGMVGGEGMTEALRDYLEERFVTVLSGYGASDLTIGIGGESRLTVWLRDQIVADPALRAAVLGPDESRIPMIFQYNPLETYLETDDDGELLCTLNSTAVLSPKLRYNIGDEASLMDFPDLEHLIRSHPAHREGMQRAQAVDRMRLPLLFLYGRKDSTVSFMGANNLPPGRRVRPLRRQHPGEPPRRIHAHPRGDTTARRPPGGQPAAAPVRGPRRGRAGGARGHLPAGRRRAPHGGQPGLPPVGRGGRELGPDHRAGARLRHRPVRGCVQQDQEGLPPRMTS